MASEAEGSLSLFPQLCGFTQQQSSGNNPVLQGTLLLPQPWVMPLRAGLGPLCVTSSHLRTVLGLWGRVLCNWQFCNM